MNVLHERCAGLDVHKDLVVACVRIAEGRHIREELRRFSTTTAALLELLDWLASWKCTHVVMEATGVYWKPVWHILESHFDLALANPLHVKNVPGRKSDVNDATWLANLLAHGLVRPSFIPPTPILELRDLTRTRRQLVREIGQHTQRIQRILEDANIKLASVLSDIMGLSGRRILQAIIAGETDPEKLAELGDKRLKCSQTQLREALRGLVTTHHRFLLRQHLRTVEHLEATINEIDGEIARALEPFRERARLLTTAPGIADAAAAVILAEIGPDMRPFPDAAHLRSWTGFCPRQDESAGKHRSTKLRKGAPWLKPVLIQCAWAATRTKGTYAHAQFHRLRARLGPKRAVAAVAAGLVTAIYYMLRDGNPYQDIPPQPPGDRDRLARRLARRIRELGFEVTVHQAA